MATQKELTGIWWNVENKTARNHHDGIPRIVQHVLDLASDYDPDWFCAQEAYRLGSDDQRSLVAMIEQQTGWKSHFFVAEEYEETSIDGGSSSPFMEGVATFSKHPIASHEEIVLGPSSRSYDHGIDGRQQLANTTLLTDVGAITVGNTHWTAMIPWLKRTRKSRKNEMEKFSEHIQSRDPDETYIVGGDFNTPPAHPIIRSLRRYLDLRTGRWHKPTWVHGGKPRTPFRFNLDYVGVPHDSDLKIVKFSTEKRGPSDHAPLIARCILNNSLDVQLI